MLSQERRIGAAFIQTSDFRRDQKKKGKRRPHKGPFFERMGGMRGRDEFKILEEEKRGSIKREHRDLKLLL